MTRIRPPGVFIHLFWPPPTPRAPESWGGCRWGPVRPSVHLRGQTARQGGRGGRGGLRAGIWVDTPISPCLLPAPLPFSPPRPHNTTQGRAKAPPVPSLPCPSSSSVPSVHFYSCLFATHREEKEGTDPRAATGARPPSPPAPPSNVLRAWHSGDEEHFTPRHGDSRPLCLSACIPARGSAGQQHPSVHPNGPAGGERGPRRRFPWSFPIRATRPVPPVTSAVAAGRSRRWRWPRRGAGGPGAAAPRAPRPSRGGCC